MTERPSPTRVRVSSPTERRNPATVDIDTAPTEDLVAMLHAEDARVIPAVAATLPTLARLVDAAVERVRSGGRVHYFGAGTSGRLGVLDAAELMPTYGVGDVVIAHHAGGTSALLTAAENVEDDEQDGTRAAGTVTAADVAIGLTASGRTPYVAGALRSARAVGALTALITSNPDPKLAPLADLLLAADTGPEAITGSTRLKAGTAEKLILNGFSTALMVRLGKVYSNLMIGMQPTNAKLRGRSVDRLWPAPGASADRCSAALDAAGEIPPALLLLLSGSSPDAAGVLRCREALRDAGGLVRGALTALRAAGDGRGDG
jgi:N-acetylmuramic acid 6-phosphate etherase